MSALLAAKTIDEQIVAAYQALVAARKKGTDNLAILLAEAHVNELLDKKLAEAA